MAKNDGREDEMDALMDIPGVSKDKILEQLGKGSGSPSDTTDPPDDKDKDKDKGNQGDNKDKGSDKGGDDKDKNKNVPDEATIKAGMLNEMFGDQFKTVDEVKQANIPAALQELPTLRQKVKDLETQLGTKPKHSFANDDLAKFNEFVGATGIHSFEVFSKLNKTDLANMDDMDALIWLRLTEDPDLLADIPRVRRNFERKFNVDKSKIEAGDLTQDEYDDNVFNMRTEARNAKKKLAEYKEKIKMPEIKEEAKESTGVQKWTPEVETKQKQNWGGTVKAIADVFSKIAIPMKGSKEPIIQFAIPDEVKAAMMQDAIDHAVRNQMELSDTDAKANEAKILSIAERMYDRAVSKNLDLIIHAVFERVSGMTEEEKMKQYSNPSKIERKEEGSDKKSTYEEKQQKAYDLDYNR